MELDGEASPANLGLEANERLGSVLSLRLLQQRAPDAAFDALFRPALRGLQGPLTGQECGALARGVEAACASGHYGLAFASLWPDAGVGGDAAQAGASFREEIVAALLRAERDARREGRLFIAEAPRAALCRPLADRIAASLAPPECLTLVHAPDADGSYAAMRSWSVDAGAAARRLGGNGTTSEAHAWTSDASHAVKTLAEAIA